MAGSALDERADTAQRTMRQVLAQLQEHYQRAPRPVLPVLKEGELPAVRPPAMFQPDPPMAVSPAVARWAKRLIDLDPEMKANVTRIVGGPTTATIDLFGPDRALKGPAILGGYQGTRSRALPQEWGTLSIRPERHGSEADMVDTLAHELAHAAGHRETGAYATEPLTRPLRDHLLAQLRK